MKNNLLQIDLLKTFSIFSVIILHTVPYDIKAKYLFTLYFWQAVPLFMIIMAFNAANSSNRTAINVIFDTSLLIKRFKRLVHPYIVIYIFSLFIALKRGTLDYNLLTFIGFLPTPGPGNYFVPLLFQFTIIFPIIYYYYKIYPKITLLLCFFLNFIFEIFAKSTYIFIKYPDLLNISVFRFLSAIALGIWISTDYKISSKRNIFVLPFAIVSFLYLLSFSLYKYEIPFFLPNWGAQNLFAFFYPLALIMLALNFVPNSANNNFTRILILISKASYHIFLVQIIYFVIFTPGIHFDFYIILNLVICTILGVMFYKLEQKFVNNPLQLQGLRQSSSGY